MIYLTRPKRLKVETIQVEIFQESSLKGDIYFSVQFMKKSHWKRLFHKKFD